MTSQENAKNLKKSINAIIKELSKKADSYTGKDWSEVGELGRIKEYLSEALRKEEYK